MGHLTVRRLAASGLLAVALSALTACGGDTEEAQDPTGPTSSSEASEPSGSESSDVPADAPACAEVWVAGGKIARTYQGCVDESGAYVERDSVGCSSGQRLIVFGDRFWGVQGGTVYEAEGSLDEDRDYRDATRRCAA
jgi:hypothetical protein